MKPILSPSRVALMVTAALAASAVTGHAQSAIATISDVPSGGSFDYTIVLKNTGTLPLNGFWYGWTEFGNNLPSVPSNAGNLSAWDNEVSGKSIMWNNSSGTPLAPGGTATFTFVSTDSPTAITTSPSGGSVAYTGEIDFSQGIAGDSTGAFSPVLTPEPSTFGLLAVGSLGFIGRIRRKVARQ